LTSLEATVAARLNNFNFPSGQGKGGPKNHLVAPRARCVRIDTRNKIKKITNSILAIPAAATATPVKPSIPAIKAIIKNSKAQ